MSIFKLYNFVSMHLDALRGKGFSIDVARAPREAFYGNITAVDAVFAKQTETGLWVFDSQHITIEKNIDPDNPAMGPHWTIRYRHKKDPTLSCVVHAYFNKKIVPNGCYQQRVIQTAQDGTESIIFSDNYDEGKMRTEAPYPGIPLTLNQIKNLAAIGARIFTALDAERAAKYVELYQEIQKKELELTKILHNKYEDNLEKASIELNGLRPLILELNLYSDGKKDFTDVFIQRRIDALKNESTPRIKPFIQDGVVEDIASLEQPDLAVQILPDRKDEKEKEKNSMQTQIMDLLDQVLCMQAENNLDTEVFYQRLQALNTAVTLFELTFEAVDDQAFSRAQRAQLPEHYFNLPDHFRQAILSGDLSTVRAMFGAVELNMDWVLLFSELLEIIEAGKDSRLCDRLIPIVYYLHEHSDLFQAFVRFKMTRLEYPAHQKLFDGDLRVNLLSMLYCINNIKAYRLYLDLGCSPEGVHAHCGQVAFNALQTILLLSNQASNRRPYVEALFQHGAVSSTAPYVLSDFYVSHALIDTHTANNPAAVSTTLFHHAMQQRPGKMKGSKLVKQSKPKAIGLLEDVRDLGILIQKENILAWSWALYPLREPEVIGLMASHCDMKTCLLEFSKIVAQDNFTVVFIPSTRGGAAFHMNEKQIEKNASKHMDFSDLDNITMYAVSSANPNRFMPQEPLCLAERKTMRAYVTFNPAYYMSVEKQEKLLKSAQFVYQGFERSFQDISEQEKHHFVEGLMRLVIQSKLSGAPLIETLKLYHAVITAHSLLNQMGVKDYQSMIKFFLAYGKTFDQLKGSPTVVPSQICTNLEVLLLNTKLHPGIVAALEPEIRTIREVADSNPAGSLGRTMLK